MKKLLSLTSCLPLLLCACGDDAGGGGGAGVSPEAGATRSAESALQLQALVDSPADQAAIGGVANLYANVQSVSAASAANNASSPTTGFGFLTATQAQFAPECVATDGDTTTYTDCEVQGVSVSGTVSGDGAATVDVDLTVTVDPAAYNGPLNDSGAPVSVDAVEVLEYGALDYSSGIFGTMNFDIAVTVTIDMGGMGMGGIPIPGAEDGTITETQITRLVAEFEVETTGGCATGGTLTVTDTNMGENGVTIVDFGPNCGDAEVRP